ncbi:RHS repeat-associated core domain-containing protein [Pseudomonas sp. G2-4]|uniref:RHS repeat-associated core domain-containing protein n=1 Tax=Pseudomonas sp. G2-4 TaxID=1506334 RepID=UPI0024BA8D5F|nr:RHS repeat-associated core domain-containing protein [Pseudomonas sp. G2-4]WHS58026.1 RHS repeat-associated core domain-containing protein [Pseudomonas sp. G2-4]
MSAPSMKILCRYQYDPLDRLVGLKPQENPGTQRFYQEDELVNEIEGQSQLTIMRHGPQPLAQRSGTDDAAETTLLATDLQRSLLRTVADTHSRQMAYTAYGYRPGESGLSCLLGFNGERPDSITGHYLLGQGNRAFNPVLMRFNSPDELSPFGDGGINAYAYCGNDPVNRYDPSGNMPFFRPWTSQRYIRPSTSQAYLPPVQKTALDLSTPRTFTRSTQTETNLSAELIANNHATPGTLPGIPNKTQVRLEALPAEGKERGPYIPIDNLPAIDRKRIIRIRARAERARRYDRIIGPFLERTPHDQIVIDKTLKTQYNAATKKPAQLKANRASQNTHTLTPKFSNISSIRIRAKDKFLKDNAELIRKLNL